MQREERCEVVPVLFSVTPVLLRWRSQGSGVLSLCFACCQGGRTQQAACLPWCLCGLLNHKPLSRSATWVMTTPGTLSPRCHFCHWLSCWLGPCIPHLLFSTHVLTPSCLERRKGELRQLWKKKKNDNRSRSWKAANRDDVSKCFLRNNFFPSHTEGDGRRHTEVGILVWKQ